MWVLLLTLNLGGIDAVDGAPAASPPVDAEAVGALIRAGRPELVTEDPRDPAYLIGKELRCPVCQGMPIADSPSEMAQDMMRRVRAMQRDGKTREEILDSFARSYGDWVLLRPRADGVSSFVWLLPPAGLLLALIAVASTVRRHRQAPAARSAAPPAAPADDYLRQVRDEVDA